jgi:single-stranded DNA-binding protein
VRVNCWRRLAEGVVASIKVGDPVVVHGRLYTGSGRRKDGQRRTGVRTRGRLRGARPGARRRGCSGVAG